MQSENGNNEWKHAIDISFVFTARMPTNNITNFVSANLYVTIKCNYAKRVGTYTLQFRQHIMMLAMRRITTRMESMTLN